MASLRDSRGTVNFSIDLQEKTSENYKSAKIRLNKYKSAKKQFFVFADVCTFSFFKATHLQILVFFCPSDVPQDNTCTFKNGT